MSVTKGYITEEDIDPAYMTSLVVAIKPKLIAIAKKDDPIFDDVIESTIYKVLIYINSIVLPKALHFTVAEMCARQLIDYETGLTSEKGEGAVKKVQRGGFSQEFETKQASSSIPRGTQFMQDYAKFLNRFRKMRTI
jgi:hypothetical protein